MDIDDLKRDLAEGKALLEALQTALSETLLQLNILDSVARRAEVIVGDAQSRIEENPDDAAAWKTLTDCQNLVQPLTETFNQYVVKRDQEQSAIDSLVITLKNLERTIMEWDTSSNDN